MSTSNRLNIFVKSRYSLAEEDRLVNGLLVLFQQCPLGFSQRFCDFAGIGTKIESPFQIREHIPYGPASIIDAELLIPESLVVAIEAKVVEGALDRTDQVERYLQLLADRKEARRILLLISPDSEPPLVVKPSEGQGASHDVVWRSWSSLYDFIRGQSRTPLFQSELPSFLVSQYLEYMTALGLTASSFGESSAEQTPLLQFLLGSLAVERTLLQIYHNGGTHVRGLARDQGLSVGSFQYALAKLHKAGLLKREDRGRVVWYSFDYGHPFISPVLELTRLAYESMPEDQRRQIFEPNYEVEGTSNRDD
jgi:hypothetical protein